MVKLEIRVKIIPHKKNEFMQAVKNICNSESQFDPVTPLAAFQQLDDDNIFTFVGEWKSRHNLENFLNSSAYEMLIGAFHVLGEIQQAHIYDIDTTEDINI